MYMAVYRPCNGSVHGSFGRVYVHVWVAYTAVDTDGPCTRPVSLYTARTRPTTRSDAAVYTAVYTRIRVHRRYKAVYAPYTRPCTRPVHSRIHGPCTRPVHGSVNVRVHGTCTLPRTRPVVYMAGKPTGPCTRSQTARYDRVRPVTAVYTARSQPVHGSVTRPSDTCIRLHRS